MLTSGGVSRSVLTSSLSDVAKLAGLEPLQHQLEGPCADARASGEGMFHGADGEKDQPDNRCQGQHHQPVRPRVLQAEEVGKAHCRYPAEDQNGPENSGNTFLRRNQTQPPCISQGIDLVEPFRVELFFALRAWLEPLYVVQDVIDDGPPSGSPSGLRHQGCLPL